jgi:ketosteroid isomerase-like protein
MKKLLVILVSGLALAAVMPSTLFCQSTDANTIAAITKLENDAVKADLANDSAFYEKHFADDWTGGTSRGTWDTKQLILADMKDSKNNKTNSESISDLKVRVYGDVAVATYKSTYDSLIRGKHYARTIITTDVFQQRNGEWKQIAGHSSVAAEQLSAKK